MTRVGRVRWVAAAGVVVAGLVAGATASAHGEDIERPAPPTGRSDQPQPPPPGYGTPPPPGYVAPPPGYPPPAEGAEGGEGAEHEPRFLLGLDLVLGWGNVPFAVQNLPVNGNPNITYTGSDKTASNVQSFILDASAEVGHHVGIGLRVPFTFAGFMPNGSAARATTDFGNIELEGEYTPHLGRGLRLVAALGVALPTAQGDEIPAGLANAPSSAVDQTAYDRWSLARAAAFARGYEDNALFEPHRLGIIPKLGLAYEARGLSLEPYVKVENLVGTQTTLAQSYVGELVAGLRVGYWVQRQFQVALKGWVNVGYAGADEDKKTAAALEPQLVLRFGPVRPYAGVIIPLTGLPQDNSFLGVRVGVAGGF